MAFNSESLITVGGVVSPSVMYSGSEFPGVLARELDDGGLFFAGIQTLAMVSIEYSHELVARNSSDAKVNAVVELDSERPGFVSNCP